MSKTPVCIERLCPAAMSEGDVKPQNPVVPEAHQVDTFHVPKAFYE